jgi:hypothetical protein
MALPTWRENSPGRRLRPRPRSHRGSRCSWDARLQRECAWTPAICRGSCRICASPRSTVQSWLRRPVDFRRCGPSTHNERTSLRRYRRSSSSSRRSGSFLKRHWHRDGKVQSAIGNLGAVAARILRPATSCTAEQHSRAATIVTAEYFAGPMARAVSTRWASKIRDPDQERVSPHQRATSSVGLQRFRDRPAQLCNGSMKTMMLPAVAPTRAQPG